MSGRTLIIGALILGSGYLIYRLTQPAQARQPEAKQPGGVLDTSLHIGPEPEVGTEEWEKWALFGGSDI